MPSSRAFARILPLFGTFFLPVSANADVFELTNSGELVEISRPVWQPETAVLPQPAEASAVPSPAPVPASPAVQGVRQQIQATAVRYGVNSDLVDAVAWQESRYNARARSSAGAMGVMQLMPGTARQMGVSDPHDVSQNVAGGTAYLREQLVRFGNNVPLALAAYNAGPGAVIKYGGIPPYRETQNYVHRIMQRLSAIAASRGEQ
jgi:soluble lytic murein transglycosylase-like protein